MENPTPYAFRHIVLAGATGLAGRALLDGLVTDAEVEKVHVLSRRPLELKHPKLSVQVVDFTALPPLPPVTEAYLALGTTIKAAGSKTAFRAVDFDANLAVARAAHAAGARRLGVVSAMGANARSRIFYNRVKGELEEALAGLGFDALVIARPSLLLGDRQRLGQPTRRGETLATYVSKFLGPLLPANVKPIAALDVAGTLLGRVPLAHGREVLLSGEMRGCGLQG